VTATKPETVELEFTAATRSDERSLSGAAAHGDYLFVAPDEGVSIVRMRRKQDSPDYDHAQVCPVDADAEPGVGKTHIAQALAHLAIRAGAEARFIKTSRALVDLAGGHADGTWTRLRELARPAVLVLDDFAMRELTPAQADDLYELIERAGRSLILTSNRSRWTGIHCSPTPSSPNPYSTD
jgi:hypothetical protein